MPDAVEFTLSLPEDSASNLREMTTLLRYCERRFGTDDLVVIDQPRMAPDDPYVFVVKRREPDA